MSRQIYTSARILPTLLLGALFSLRTPPAQAPPLFQIATSQPGVYRVTYEALVVAGLSDQPVPSEMLSLSHRGTPVPIWIQKGHNTRDGQFGPGDWFEFVAERLAGDGRYFHAYSRDNIYWLGWERRAATRMAVVPAPSIDTRPPAARAAPLRRHQHLEYDRLFVRLGLHFRALSEPAAFAQPVQKEPSTGDTRLPCLHLPPLGWPRPAFCPAGRRRQLGH
jgi:hypothetical protein